MILKKTITKEEQTRVQELLCILIDFSKIGRMIYEYYDEKSQQLITEGYKWTRQEKRKIKSFRKQQVYTKLEACFQSLEVVDSSKEEKKSYKTLKR